MKKSTGTARFDKKRCIGVIGNTQSKPIFSGQQDKEKRSKVKKERDKRQRKETNDIEIENREPARMSDQWE
jgi:hypothetical protein